MNPLINWQKSSFSGGGDGNDCVEVAASLDGGIRLRESDAPGTVLSTTPARLASLIREVKAGSFA